RVFKPKPEFSKRAHIKSLSDYKKLYNASVRNPEKFWAEAAGELVWFKKWRKVLQWKPPFAKWFVGGKLNVSYNCLDRHLGTWRRNKAALVWEGEPGDTRILTYQQLHREVCKFANVLKRLGVAKGDRVILYLPLIPELAIAMLACTRIGATHSIIFGGFSSQALVDRISDAQATVVVTADGGYRRGSIVALKENVDEALRELPFVRDVIVVRRTERKVAMEPGRDHSWEDLMKSAEETCAAE